MLPKVGSSVLCLYLKHPKNCEIEKIFVRKIYGVYSMTMQNRKFEFVQVPQNIYLNENKFKSSQTMIEQDNTSKCDY